MKVIGNVQIYPIASSLSIELLCSSIHLSTKLDLFVTFFKKFSFFFFDSRITKKKKNRQKDELK